MSFAQVAEWLGSLRPCIWFNKKITKEIENNFTNIFIGTIGEI
jgi:hypothetical protein